MDWIQLAQDGPLEGFCVHVQIFLSDKRQTDIHVGVKMREEG